MGPVRGMKRRKKAEKKVDQNVLAAAASLSSQPQPVDWWDDFSQRITGLGSNAVLKNWIDFIMHGDPLWEAVSFLGLIRWESSSQN
ncbi:unnamed protein product [Prunus armeniaca]|uniref:Uncharacterized protein n=1 Tax=Prunus armeniaca TaxID=36596 RepID=A0A6J5U524_PRUAR|nr:unnamed protein product [Prunus armeniaca]CAB4301106.1 unnamed protein product [Prunus armeniaca]